MVVTKDVDVIVFSLVSRMNLYNRYRAQRELAFVKEQILQNNRADIRCSERTRLCKGADTAVDYTHEDTKTL